ncbi:MAG: CinA family protein, partial [Actinobacteria bacterium]
MFLARECVAPAGHGPPIPARADSMQDRGSTTRPGGTSNDVSRSATAGLVASALGGRAVASAESCTAGRICEALATVTGASDWFRGGVVAYQEPVKRALLDVEAASVLSEQAAAEMATGVAELLEADVSVATTGVAGDEPVDGVAPGTVFIATCVGGS